MLRGNFGIGKIFGIPIEINVSWLLILLLVTWTVAENYLAPMFPYMPVFTTWVLGAMSALMLFGSILFHELMHSVVAVRNGLPVRKITLFMFGGVAQMSGEPQSAAVEFKMALAGPLASFILSALFYITYIVLYDFGSYPVASAIFMYLALINFMVLVFNMVPGFPLDGGRVLRSIIWHFTGNITRATYISSRIGKAFAILLIVLGLFSVFTGNFIGGIWLVFIGFFLQQAADSGYYQVMMRRGLEGHFVWEVMQPEVVTVDADTPIETAVHNYFMRYRFNSFPVLENNRLVGMLTTHDLKTIPREEWDYKRVRDIMETEPIKHALDPNENVYTALMKIARDGMGRLPVVQGGKLVGIISNRDIMKLLRVKMDIGA